MKRCLVIFLMGLALLLTGCPRNEYVVELKPHGNTIERTLTYYRVDVDGSNNFINYQTFPDEEMDAINALYPASSVTNHGERHTARGTFTNALPHDVGGVGTYTNLSTSLGSAEFYVERFRGNDDIAGLTEKHFKAADQLTDLLLGWTKSELGSEPGYEKLRQFLNADFRLDLKNFSSYWWESQVATMYRTNTAEEFIVRFGQYLVERGYIQIGEMPVLWRDASDHSGEKFSLLMRRVVARKMGVPDSQPLPVSLDFLADDDTIDKSFGKYLTTTDLYRARLKQWEKEKEANPKLEKLEPTEVAEEIALGLIDFELFGGPADRLTVKLSLPAAPAHSNGRWDETTKQVIWETDVADRTNVTHFPAFCFANWAEPAGSYQKEHFGKVAITRDDLTGYCLWRSGLDEKLAGEWDALLSGLRPGEQLTNKLNAFRFAGEPPQSDTNTYSLADYPRKLIIEGLK